MNIPISPTLLSLSALIFALVQHSALWGQENVTTTRIVRSTCLISGEGSTATCFVVKVDSGSGRKADRVLVTAAHVLEKMKGSAPRKAQPTSKDVGE